MADIGSKQDKHILIDAAADPDVCTILIIKADTASGLLDGKYRPVALDAFIPPGLQPRFSAWVSEYQQFLRSAEQPRRKIDILGENHTRRGELLAGMIKQSVPAIQIFYFNISAAIRSDLQSELIDDHHPYVTEISIKS